MPLRSEQSFCPLTPHPISNQKIRALEYELESLEPAQLNALNLTPRSLGVYELKLLLSLQLQ